MVRPYSKPEDRARDMLNDKRLHPENKVLLNRWYNERIEINKFEIKSTVCKLYSLHKLSLKIKVPLESIKTRKQVEEILKFEDFNKQYFKKLIKYFYKWLEGTEEYPDHVRWINTKKNERERKVPRRKITNEEKEALLKSLTNQRDRVIAKMLMEYPIRSCEICTIDMGDVEFDKDGVVVKLGKVGKTKTGERIARFINCAIDIKLYYENHPFKDNKEAPFFYQLSTNRFGQRMGYNAISNTIENACKRAGIRKINTHDFRHTSTSELLQDPDYTIAEVKAMGGWKSLRTVDTYNKVTSEDVAEKRRNGNKNIKIDYEKAIRPTTCPRCNNQTPSDFKHCIDCGLAKTEFAQEIEQNFMKMILPELMEKRKEEIKAIAKQKVKEKPQLLQMLQEIKNQKGFI